MMRYGQRERDSDFDFFLRHYSELYSTYGHQFLAIRKHCVLGAFKSALDAIEQLAPQYEIGAYIIQECAEDDSAYRRYLYKDRTF